MLRDVLIVGVGGFVGSMIRFLVSTYVLMWIPQSFIPLGTLTVNILGSFLIGVLASILSNNTLYFMAVVGFCGGFTTFSTLSLEVVDMLKLGEWRNVLLYVGVSLILCVLLTALGFWIGERYIMNRV